MAVVTVSTFILFTALVALGTWLIVRKQDISNQDGFFLAGRGLSFPFIAGSLLLTNLSTEQMVGLNGSAFKEGLSVMAWEVVAVFALVMMALFFLPKFLKSGITTIPEYLEYRFDKTTALICNIIFLLAYMVILLPIILYTGARGMIDVLDLGALTGLNDTALLWIIVILTAVIGSIYAIAGGLNSCAVSDTLNGIGLLIGGFMITFFAVGLLGDGFTDGVNNFFEASGPRLNSIGANDAETPFFALFTGILIINTFYWCTNQQIIQRTLGAKSLAEGQKGVLLTGALKLLGPIYLVIPGLIAAILYMQGTLNIPDGSSDKAYGALVSLVLPAPLKGFFAAVLLGAILSSFNSALNSTCTLFSLGIYKPYMAPYADDKKVIKVGQIFGFILTAGSIIIAPLLAKTGSIFNYLQNMNAIYFIPIFAVVVIGMCTKYVPAAAAKIALIAGVIAIALGYFVPPFTRIAETLTNYHFAGLVFLLLITGMILHSVIAPRETAFVEVDAKVTDLTPWKYTKLVSAVLLIIIVAIYAAFADFSVFRNGKPAPPAPPQTVETPE